MNQDMIGKLAGLLMLIGFAFYNYNSYKRGHKPKRASWIIWTSAAFMLLASFRALGSHFTFWVAVAGVIGPLITAIISIWYNSGEPWERLEVVCLMVALLSAILWYLTKQPVSH